MKITPRHFRIFTLCILAAASLSSCSVDMFAKPAADSEIIGQQKYRGARPECVGIRVDRPELDAKTFRKLIQCFAANGSLPEISPLVAEASETTLEQSIAILNTTFLSNRKSLGDSRGSVQKMRETGIWDKALAGVTPFVADPERARAVARFISRGSNEPLVQKTIQRLDAAETLAGFEILGRLLKSPVFSSLRENIRAHPLSKAESDRLFELFRDMTGHPTAYKSAGRVLTDLADGKGKSVIDFILGESGDVLPASSRFYSLLEHFSQPGTHNSLRALSRFQRGFHGPLSCWGGGKVFAEPWKNLVSEMSGRKGEDLITFLTRFASTTGLGVQGLCDVPGEILEHHSAVMDLLRGPVGGEYFGILERIVNSGMGESAGYAVGEWGETFAEGLSILGPKPWFKDLILLLAELGPSDRDRIGEWAKVLLRDQAEWSRIASAWTTQDLTAVFQDLGVIFNTELAVQISAIDSIVSLLSSTEVHPWFDGLKRLALAAKRLSLSSLVNHRELPALLNALTKMSSDGRLAILLGDGLELLAGGEPAGDPALFKAMEFSRFPLRHLYRGVDLKVTSIALVLNESIAACTQLSLRTRANDQWDQYERCALGGGVSRDALSSLRSSGNWKIKGEGGQSVSLLEFLGQSWTRLPLTVSEKRDLIQSLTGKGSKLPELNAGAVSEWVSAIRFKLGMESEAPSRVFSILNQFQVHYGVGIGTWKTFFTHVQNGILDARSSVVLSALRSVKKIAPADDIRIRPAPLAPVEASKAWISELECVDDQQEMTRRSNQLNQEFSQAVHGFEWRGGKLPLQWDSKDLQPRVQGALDALASPSLRQGLYRWIREINPNSAAEWFHRRSSDPKWVALLDPESRQVKVRWMTSLDRLESILVQSDFSYLLSTNYGLKFIARFAEAWGDEPRSQWPAEIQAKYRGRKMPPTLREIFREVESFLAWFERVGGLARPPSCIDRNGVIAKTALDAPWASAPDLLIPFEIKAKAFNLKQTLSVIEENLPGSSSPNAGGMRLLRGLFWSVLASVPERDRIPSRPDKNPLRIFQRLGDLGVLRSVSRGLQSFEYASEQYALIDAIAGAGLIAEVPAFDRIIAKILTRPDSVAYWIETMTSDSGFHWDALLTKALSGAAAERTLRISRSTLEFIDQNLEASNFPTRLSADLMRFMGRNSSSQLTTLRIENRESVNKIRELNALLGAHLFRGLSAFPIQKMIAGIERDDSLREQIFLEFSRVSASQNNGGRFSAQTEALMTQLLSDDNPAARRFIALWCGTNAATLVSEFATRPDKALLIIDGLTQSAQSDVFTEFMEALLRQLPD